MESCGRLRPYPERNGLLEFMDVECIPLFREARRRPPSEFYLPITSIRSMKNTLLTSLVLLSLCTCVRAQADIPVSHPVDFISKFQDIHVATDGSGLVVGRCGVIRETMTDGAMWETIVSPTEANLESVACPPSGCATALVLAEDGLYRRTISSDWVSIDSPNAAFSFGTLHWLTAGVVLHETNGESFYRSADGGLTWAEIPLTDFERGNFAFIGTTDFYFWDGNALQRSTDGGATHTAVGYVHPNRVDRQAWLDEDNGWLFDSERIFYRTSDGGQTWIRLQEDSPLTSVNWFEALSETHLVGAQIVTTRLESLDGGVTWTRTSFLEQGNRRVNPRYHRRGNEFFTAGDGSQILYSPADFTDWRELDPFERTDRVTRIKMASTEIGYAIAGSRLLVMTDGMNWALSPSSIAGSNRDMAVLEDGRVVVTGSSAMRISADQGQTFTSWGPADLLQSGEYGLLISRKPNGNYYLLGADHATETSDNGANWIVHNHNSELSYHGLYWISNEIGYAFTRQQHFAKTTDGGQSWTVGDAPARNLEGIWFTDEMNGWVSSASRRWTTSDGGATWTPQNQDGGYNYQMADNGDLFVATYLGGNNGAITWSKDNGDTWRQLNFNCYAYRAGDMTPDGKYFWTGGDGGFLVRHDLEALIENANSVRRPAAPVYTSITAYPNPTAGQATLELPTGAPAGSVSLHDLSGRVVRALTTPTAVERVDLSLTGLPAGVYVLRWRAGQLAGRTRLVKH